MARTTTSEVQGVLLSEYDGTSSLAPFIASANVVVTRVSTCATNKGTTLSSTELELIERWLAAHLYKMTDRQFTNKSESGAGNSASGTFAGNFGMALEASTFGQTAMLLDPSGCLAALSKRNIARAFWLGKPPSEQTDYQDRD